MKEKGGSINEIEEEAETEEEEEDEDEEEEEEEEEEGHCKPEPASCIGSRITGNT